MSLVNLNPEEVIEWQFNSDGTSEGSFKLNTLSGISLYNYALSNFDLEGINTDHVDMISMTAASKNIGIIDDAIVLVMNGVPEPNQNWADYYAIKIQKNGSRVIKYYTLDFDLFEHHPLPPASKIAFEFGMGCYPKTGLEVRDLYFYHNHQTEVEDFIGLKISTPSHVLPNSFGVYGVTYGPDLKPQKLKRYYFPSDPELKYPERI